MMPRQEFVTLMILAMLAAIVVFMLASCAGPEPGAPIQAYREQFGFTP